MIIPKREHDKIMARFNHFREYQDVKAAKEEIALLVDTDNLPETMMIQAVMDGTAKIGEYNLDEFLRSLK